MARKRRRNDPFAELIAPIILLAYFGFYYWTRSFQQATVLTLILACLLIGLLVIFALWKREKLKKSGIHEIDKMDGRQFEKYLEVLFKSLGYKTKLTRYVGDYGADLILEKDGKKIVVQAKRYSKDVGINAVQEIAAAMPHYKADEAWIVTNRDFTEAARNLAKSNGVKLINRTKLIDFILKMNPEAVPYPKKIMEENPTQQFTCKRCGRLMVLRKGPKGEFYGCSGFPKCRYTMSVER